MKIQRLYEDRGLLNESPDTIILNEGTSYIVTPGCYHAVQEIIKSYVLSPKETRGNGVLCEVLISMYNALNGTSLVATDYCIHHLNGLHTVNTYDNIVLINSKKYHTSLHSDLIHSVIGKFLHSMGFTPGMVATPQMFTGLSTTDKYKLLIIYMELCALKTSRIQSHTVIYVKDFIQ